MDSLEPSAQSFIVKVWVEDNIDAGGQTVFRGHITHVPSYERRYLKNLGEIERFIAPYLEEMGVRFDKSRWMARWFYRLRTHS